MSIFSRRARLVDFDTLVIKAAELLERPDDGAAVRSRWDVVLVDEFQDLNPVQYRIVRALAARPPARVRRRRRRAVDLLLGRRRPARLSTSFVNDFELVATEVHLEENRRCPHERLRARAQARRGQPADVREPRCRRAPIASRRSRSSPRASRRTTTRSAWIIDDVERDRAEHGHDWGDVALLYRKHEIGEALEAAFLNAGIPCRLAQGRALADDPVVAYVHRRAARHRATRATTCSATRSSASCFRGRCSTKRARKADSHRRTLGRQLKYMARGFRARDENARQIRRALADWRNLEALGKSHTSLARARAGPAVATRRHVCARCSTTATTRSAIRRCSPTSSRSRRGLRDARDRARRDLDAAHERRGDRAQGHARVDRVHAR